MPPAAAAAQDAEISKADFFEEGRAPVRKPTGYDATIIYFIDYQCPSCRKYTPDVTRALGEDRKVRVIYRDTPIFGERSDVAARLAIASQFQGRHEAFHHALMTGPMPLDETALRAAARKAGVDWAKLQEDLKTHREDIDLQIARNFELALAAGIAGTPAFIIGETLANGALDYEGLKAEIADARQTAGSAADAAQPVSPGNAKDEPAKVPAGATAPSDSPRLQPAVAEPLFRPASGAQAAEESRGSPARPPAWLVSAALLALLAAIVLLARRRSSSARREDAL